MLLGPLGVPFPKLPGVSVWQVTFCWHWAPGSGEGEAGGGEHGLRKGNFQCMFDSRPHSRSLLIKATDAARKDLLPTISELASPEAPLAVIRTSGIQGGKKAERTRVSGPIFKEKKRMRDP